MSFVFERVTVVGLGYIGLPTAAVLASTGVKVLGVDINSDAVETINRGEIHIVEPDLDKLVRDTVANGNLRASTTVEQADAFIIAVPTPFKGQHQPDISYVESATKSIAPFLKKGDLVILESTCPVGTTEKMTQWLADARPELKFPSEINDDTDINLAYCPERVLPGKVLTELISNDRVIGGITSNCSQRAQALYKQFVKGECVLTEARTAEMCKLTENSFRDVNIAFANELSLICEKLDINVWELVRLANRHPRVNILNPGPGVGGHCIAVDPWFIVDSAPELSKIISTARAVNDGKPLFVVEQVQKAAALYEAPTVACFGLAFKADIDDLRESPAVHIVQMLAQQGLQLLLVEPFIHALPKNLANFDNVKLVSIEEALLKANVVVSLVDHTCFKEIDSAVLAKKAIVDARGIWA
ncbi:NDP-N-acetyl-d-galactosaminuronic acid dehydrogenase oxidoreductase [Janthinobacterium sp. Marseille]|nr:UDP-N-acetyl-D-mannosamine dehydrogenase [Janthinobacterium sp. Marseille]ABR88638.1 NDP-N-acetyl-d-galactosaminuronic acid dehydrogenase oxidoreductase [Janthinobacterium sp. Marseille]